MLVLIVLLVAGGVADRVVHRGSGRESARPTVSLQPSGAPASAMDATWFCTGPTTTFGLTTDTRLVIANPDSQRDLTGTVTLLPSGGAARTMSVDIRPLDRLVVRPQAIVTSSATSALVELDAGSAGVELVELGPLGPTVSPCASAASDHWYFASGATTKDATENLYVFNPFPGDALVDLSFATDLGPSSPEALASVLVPARSTRVLALNDYVRRRSAVSTVLTARTGQVVAARLQAFDGSAGPKGQAPKGVSLQLGAPSLGDHWYFPEGDVVDGITDRFDVFNPSTRAEASVELDLGLEQGQADPIQITVPPNTRVSVTTNNEHRIPPAVPYAVEVRARGGVPVVAERMIVAGPPSPRAGVALTLGSRLAGLQWLLVTGEADSSADEWVVVQNPGPSPAQVSFSVLTGGQSLAVEDLQDALVEPGLRRAFRIGDHIRRTALPLLVSSDHPVVVERDLYPITGGAAMAVGIPLSP